MLTLAVLAGYAIAECGVRIAEWRRRKRAESETQPSVKPANYALRITYYAVAAVVGALVLIEFLSIPYPMAAPGYNVPFYAELAREPGRFGILELPLRPMSDYEAYQTVHGKPIVAGY